MKAEFIVHIDLVIQEREVKVFITFELGTFQK